VLERAAVEGPVEIVSGVHGLGSKLVDWYLVQEDGRLTAVDAGLPGFGSQLEADLTAIGRRLEDVEAVVLTHSDADHTGIVPRLREAGARVLIHSADDATLRKPGPKGGDAKPVNVVPYLWRPTAWRLLAHFAANGGGKPPKVEGAETFGAGDVLDVPGRPRAVHTPGHTPGHCVLHFEGHGAVFAGDALCTRNPLTGREGPQVMPSAFNVSTDQCFESLAAIEGLAAQVLLPGHGGPWHGGASAAVARAREAGRS
jgi:glyoxylase-like metal-dependent hydrolase (beta-lactamase superfamily II)